MKTEAVCCVCKEKKNATEFYTSVKRGVVGLQSACKKCCAQRSAKYFADRPNYSKERWAREEVREAQFASRIMRQYGLTTEEYQQIMKIQGGLCGVCQIKKPTCVDHCHDTGRVRGVLCNACNRGIGMFSDKAALLIKAADYLNRASSNSRTPSLHGGYEGAIPSARTK
jgi:Recombination endonuclease VII